MKKKPEYDVIAKMVVSLKHQKDHNGERINVTEIRNLKHIPVDGRPGQYRIVGTAVYQNQKTTAKITKNVDIKYMLNGTNDLVLVD